jgi:IS5 family transposase
MENRNGLLVDARVTKVNGRAERTTALDMIEDNAGTGSTVGGDKAYDTADFVAGCRERGCTPRMSRRTTPNAARRSMPIRRAIPLQDRHPRAGGRLSWFPIRRKSHHAPA